MNTTSSQKLNVSLFQVPEEYRVHLAELVAMSKLNGHKTSINTCILHALEDYLKLQLDQQPKPTLPKAPLRTFTVRMTSTLKNNITICAAHWQLKTSLPISMNAVVNTAILAYLQKYINGYQPPF